MAKCFRGQAGGFRDGRAGAGTHGDQRRDVTRSLAELVDASSACRQSGRLTAMSLLRRMLRRCTTPPPSCLRAFVPSWEVARGVDAAIGTRTMDEAVASGGEPPPHLRQPSMPATLLLVGMVTAVLHREELAVTMDDKACGHDVVLPEPLNRWWKR
jgi:hypothetical protein